MQLIFFPLFYHPPPKRFVRLKLSRDTCVTVFFHLGQEFFVFWAPISPDFGHPLPIKPNLVELRDVLLCNRTHPLHLLQCGEVIAQQRLCSICILEVRGWDAWDVSCGEFFERLFEIYAGTSMTGSSLDVFGLRLSRNKLALSPDSTNRMYFQIEDNWE